MPGRTPTSAIPDAGLAAIAWAKSNSRLSAIHGGRVASRLPKDSLFPFLTAYLIPGPVADSYAPVHHAVIQWGCWGARIRKGDTRPDYEAAYQLAAVLRACLLDIGGEPVAATGVLGAGALADASITREPARMPDPSGCARYDLDALITVLPAAA